MSDMSEGLNPPGRGLVSAIVADMEAAGLEPDSREAALLRSAGEIVDRMADLEGILSEDGLRRLTKAGTVQLHPAAGELRQHAIALSKVLSGIALVDTSGGKVKSARHVRSASIRWAAKNG